MDRNLGKAYAWDCYGLRMDRNPAGGLGGGFLWLEDGQELGQSLCVGLLWFEAHILWSQAHILWTNLEQSSISA